MHKFGLRKTNFLLNILNFIPFYLDQIFYFKKRIIRMRLNNDTIIFSNNFENNVGSSVHYSNMKINNLSINAFLKKISLNILGIGMPFVKQKLPGPISNDIFLDAINKLK
jgi:hypothetical protein